jgi:hypothetical protein
MIKKPIPILFFTTILSSGILHAADDMDRTNVSATPIKRQIAALPSTPAITAAAEEKYPHDVFSPDSADFYRNLEITKAKNQRELQKEQFTKELQEKELVKKLTFESARVEEENRIEIEKLNTSIQSLALQLKKNQQSKGDTEAKVAALTQKIDQLVTHEADLSKKLLEEVEAEKVKKKQAITASRGAITELEASLQSYRSQISVLTTQRDVLTIENKLQATSEEGLKKQIELYQGLMETTLTTSTAALDNSSSDSLTAASTEEINVAFSEVGKTEVTAVSAIMNPAISSTESAKKPVRRKANFSGDDDS